MSTPHPRRPARGAAPLSSSQPDRLALSVEPKSDFLRSALEARRAKDALATPSPVVESRLVPQRANSMTSSTKRASSVAPSVDPWLEQAFSEEEMTPVVPMRRGRRPSESGLPRVPTQREQQSDNEKLKNKLLDNGLKMELLRKQNNELKDKLDEANAHIEDLEPLEEENIELRETNDRLTIKLQDMEEDFVHLDDSHREILQIQAETVGRMERQQAAVDEGVEIIYNLEKDKNVLQTDFDRLKEQVANIQSALNPSGHHRGMLDGAPKEKRPTRVYSIDESRPSTSHFDSDYYSQPASPQVKGKMSKDSLSYSDRVKGFLEDNIQSKKSVQDLKKRFSDASMKLLPRLDSPPPEVPEIPKVYNDAYQEKQGKGLAERFARQDRKMMRETPPPKSITLPTPRPHQATPTTPTTPGSKEGLRGLYRERRTIERPERSSRPSSSYKTPVTKSKGSQASEHGSPSVIPPQRESSRFAQTSSSEQMRASASEEAETETAPSEYTEPSLPSPPSVDTEDVASLPDSQKWWKDINRVRSNVNHGANSRVDSVTAATNSLRTKKGRPGGDLFFNPAEDEDQFMQRVKGYMPRKQ